ncbi:MAG: hypothetical protein RLZZ292_3454, partial [Bacteroidota bacterium]
MKLVTVKSLSFKHYFDIRNFGNLNFPQNINKKTITVYNKTIIGIALLFTFFTNCKERTKSEIRNPKPEIEEWVYITNEDSEDLSIISTLTNEVVATVPVGKRPRGIRIAPDGKSVFVAISGSP